MQKGLFWDVDVKPSPKTPGPKARGLTKKAPPDICRNFHKGDPASEDANPSESSKSRDAALILAAITSAGERGMNLWEVMRDLDLSHPTASARLAELRHRDKLIVRSGEKRPTKSGRMSHVLVAVRFSGRSGEM